MGRLGLHNSVTKASFATVTGRSLALGLETQYLRGFSKLGYWWRGTGPGLGCKATVHAGRPVLGSQPGLPFSGAFVYQLPLTQTLSPGGIIWPRNYQDVCDTPWFLDPAQGLHQAAVGSTKTEGPWLKHRWAWTCEFPRSCRNTSQATCSRAHARHPVYSTPGAYAWRHTHRAPASLPSAVVPASLFLLPAALWSFALLQPCQTHFHPRIFSSELSLALRLGPWSLKSHSLTLLAPSHSQMTVHFLVPSPS